MPGLLQVRREGLDVPGMVARGESDRLEFKEGLRAGQGAEGASRAVGRSLARSLGALMNSRGGTLLVGVADNGELKGLEPDFAASRLSGRDAWEQACGRGSATLSPAMPSRPSGPNTSISRERQLQSFKFRLLDIRSMSGMAHRGSCSSELDAQPSRSMRERHLSTSGGANRYCDGGSPLSDVRTVGLSHSWLPALR